MSFKFHRIMMIDDEEIDNYLTKALIKNNNLAKKVIVFNNGFDAINYIKDHKDISDKLPDLILLDIYMPKMDGIEFLDVLSGIPLVDEGKCKVCVVSSSVIDNDILKSKLSKKVHYFTKKPITLNFLQTI